MYYWHVMNTDTGEIDTSETSYRSQKKAIEAAKDVLEEFSSGFYPIKGTVEIYDNKLFEGEPVRSIDVMIYG